ncbi:uncharacterized protein TM35_000045210 [Trypanosoma theileri]|uniref:Uncharacterized protein n=1 Tax=Trypanosoma theileri TaxID=67003 RepID=A0A1X0P5U8_9TRYP|nr:uncharacterized protein TM35_000045210 [Trypanosoma theileri]ORC92307.1 hypothetical protein TM35_000045210 [Trypanosoma theileri]
MGEERSSICGRLCAFGAPNGLKFVKKPLSPFLLSGFASARAFRLYTNRGLQPHFRPTKRNQTTQPPRKAHCPKTRSESTWLPAPAPSYPCGRNAKFFQGKQKQSKPFRGKAEGPQPQHKK